MDLKHANLTLLLLFTAALLEAGGDAVVRLGLRAPTIVTRMALFTAGGLILFTYGYVVNGSPWDFGRLLGVYLVFFFVVSQAISWVIFHQGPSTAVLIGGGFIVVGGIIMAYNS